MNHAPEYDYNIFPEKPLNFNGLHGVMFQKTELFKKLERLI
jgi:hypothetical protein